MKSAETKLPELMTVKELVEYLHCDKSRAYRLVKSKSFPSLMIGGKWYVIKDDLPDWIRKQSRKMTFA